MQDHITIQQTIMQCDVCGTHWWFVYRGVPISCAKTPLSAIIHTARIWRTLNLA
jgi:hypothetical protein